jgi:N6-L-threonylcarbamoyladenine synthase
MFILGIETSCDDTGISIVGVSEKKRPIFEILSNVVSSQIKVHAKFGGVVPNLAAREHLKNIEPCLKTALNEANIKMKDIDLIAVTAGPGLIPSLLIGVNFAKALAYRFNKPIIGINHIEAHIIAAVAATNPKSRIPNPKLFPAVALVVSGGHTQLVLVKNIGNYKIIGETRDDAAGECFDKVAKLLGLGYPGGPVISAQAAQFLNPKSETPNKPKVLNFKLPRPMISHKNYDFSFSGLKTAALYLVKDNEKKAKDEKFIQELCCETQQAIIEVLISKTLRAAKDYKTKAIILSGGVAANKELRNQMSEVVKKQIPNSLFLIPDSKLCTDNGAMIARTGYFGAKRHHLTPRNNSWKRIKANANLRIG